MPFSDIESKRAYQKEYCNRPAVKKRRKAYNKVWKEANKQWGLDKGAKRRLEKRAQCLVAGCRTRARNRGIPFALDNFVTELQRRIDLNKCEITGAPFDLSPGRSWNSPSIDRIRPAEGYVPNNVRVVCHAMNVAMGDWGEEAVREMFQHWLSSDEALRSRRR